MRLVLTQPRPAYAIKLHHSQNAPTCCLLSRDLWSQPRPVSGHRNGGSIYPRSEAGRVGEPIVRKAEGVLDEADSEVIQTVQEILQGREITALKEDSVPVTILEITEIKGLGPKMAKRVYDDLGVVDIDSLKAALESGALSKVKGFGPKVTQTIAEPYPQSGEEEGDEVLTKRRIIRFVVFQAFFQQIRSARPGIRVSFSD